MEETTTPKPKSKFYNWFIIFCVLAIIPLLGFMFYRQGIDNEITRNALQTELNKERLLRTNCSDYKDSLLRVNADLSKYKTLTHAMIHRDEATSQLKHKIGELVYLKNDSSRVVIEDVLIGGGKYNYYVKYRVLLKDNTTREIVPELVY